MISWKVLPQINYRRSLWKNGLGHTDEGAELRKGDFLFRISSAQVSQNSPFSLFPDHDRVLVILQGAGMRLKHQFEEDTPPEIAEVLPLEPYEFPGDIPSECELIEGPIRDFSLFFRKGHLESNVSVIRIEDSGYEWRPTGRWNYAFSLDQNVSCESPKQEQTPEPLGPGDTLQVKLDRPLKEDEFIRLRSVSGAQLLLVSLHPV